MRGRIAITALLLLARAATAVEPDTPDLLPPWIVAESRLRPDTSPVRATALLPADTWSGRAVTTLADAFRRIPGAIMQESFGGFEPPRLSIRGSGVQSAPSSRGLALLLDGLPLGLADGSFNSALFDPLIGGRLEVQRGLDGWRLAPTTMGGALDLRTPIRNGSRSVRIEAGSYGALRARASYSTDRDGTIARIAAARAQQDGYREHSDQARTVLAASLAREMARSVTFRAGVYHAHASYAVPGPLTLSGALAAPRSISSDVARDQPERAAEITRVAATLARRTAAQEWEFAASVGRTADDFRQLQPNGTTRSRSDDASLRFTFAQRFSGVAMPHQLRVSAAADRGWRDLQRFRNDAGTLGPAFGRDGLYPTTATVQIEEAVALSRAIVATAGLAQVAAERDVVDRIGRETNLQLHSHALLPQAGIRWKVSPATSLFLTASRSVEPPTFDDLVVVGGSYPSLRRRAQPLVDQEATTLEIGARGRVATLSWDVAVYRADWKNEILRLADSRGVARGAVNATPTTHAGIEAAGRWVLIDRAPRVSLSAAASWNDIRFAGDPDYGTGRLAGVPPHVGEVELLIETRSGNFAAVGADWTHGQTRVDHAGRLGYGGRTLAHLRLGRRSAKRGTWFIEIRNVFDHPSIASTAGVLDQARNPAGTVIFLPAPGRIFNVGFEWNR